MQMENSYFLMESTPSIFERKKFCLPTKELLDTMRLSDRGTISSHKATARPHATTDKKFSIPTYADHLQFLTIRYVWKVANYTFE